MTTVLELAGYQSEVHQLLEPQKRYCVSSSGLVKVTRASHTGDVFIAIVKCSYIWLPKIKEWSTVVIENLEKPHFSVYVAEA